MTAHTCALCTVFNNLGFFKVRHLPVLIAAYISKHVVRHTECKRSLYTTQHAIAHCGVRSLRCCGRYPVAWPTFTCNTMWCSAFTEQWHCLRKDAVPGTRYLIYECTHQALTLGQQQCSAMLSSCSVGCTHSAPGFHSFSPDDGHCSITANARLLHTLLFVELFARQLQ